MEVVELMVRTSKTGFARFVPIPGATRSGIQLAQLLRNYWKPGGRSLSEAGVPRGCHESCTGL